jgi:hypothetical protein
LGQVLPQGVTDGHYRLPDIFHGKMSELMEPPTSSPFEYWDDLLTRHHFGEPEKSPPPMASRRDNNQVARRWLESQCQQIKFCTNETK